MQISGYLLPPSPSSNNQSLPENRQTLSDRYLDARKSNRQQTVEYVFQGEFLNEVSVDEQRRNQYTQTINPANQSAISSYNNTEALASRQGRLVDIFI